MRFTFFLNPSLSSRHCFCSSTVHQSKGDTRDRTQRAIPYKLLGTPALRPSYCMCLSGGHAGSHSASTSLQTPWQTTGKCSTYSEHFPAGSLAHLHCAPRQLHCVCLSVCTAHPLQDGSAVHSCNGLVHCASVGQFPLPLVCSEQAGLQ